LRALFDPAADEQNLFLRQGVSRGLGHAIAGIGFDNRLIEVTATRITRPHITCTHYFDIGSKDYAFLVGSIIMTTTERTIGNKYG
jgi:hypothetical protein